MVPSIQCIDYFQPDKLYMLHSQKELHKIRLFFQDENLGHFDWYLRSFFYEIDSRTHL